MPAQLPSFPLPHAWSFRSFSSMSYKFPSFILPIQAAAATKASYKQSNSSWWRWAWASQGSGLCTCQWTSRKWWACLIKSGRGQSFDLHSLQGLWLNHLGPQPSLCRNGALVAWMQLSRALRRQYVGPWKGCRRSCAIWTCPYWSPHNVVVRKW